MNRGLKLPDVNPPGDSPNLKNLDPMNRGLKPMLRARILKQFQRLLKNLDPMNRGLKLKTGDPIGLPRHFLKNLDPMNRGLKRDLGRLGRKDLTVLKNLDPMNRGLKREAEFPLAANVNLKNLDPMNRGLKPTDTPSAPYP